MVLTRTTPATVRNVAPSFTRDCFTRDCFQRRYATISRADKPRLPSLGASQGDPAPSLTYNGDT